MDQQPENISADQAAGHPDSASDKPTSRPRRDGEHAIERIAAAARALADNERSPNGLPKGNDDGRRARTALIPAPYIAAGPKEASRAKGRLRMPSHLPFYTAALCLALGVGGFLGGRIAQTADAPDSVAQAETTKIDRALPWKREVANVQAQANAKVREDLKALRGEMAALRANNDQLRQSEGQKQTQELRALRAALEAQKSETASLKADLAARLDRADRDAAQRTDKTVERVDRLEKKLSDPIVTGSVPKAAEAVKPEANKTERPQVRGMVLRDVDRGVALVETRRGLLEVMPGDVIPGAGRVEAIEKHAGKWRVVTTTGVIDDKPD